MSTNTILIVGLGNPGKEYDLTRHNVGFMMIDYIVTEMNVKKPNFESKFISEITLIKTPDTHIILAKPQTFMNNSGNAIQAIINYYKILPQNIWVIHDDLDIELGKHKIQLQKGPRQHNGLISIETMLKTEEFHKIRIGIENRGELRKFVSGRAYVLARFSEQEFEVLNTTAFPEIYSHIKQFLNWEN